MTIQFNKETFRDDYSFKNSDWAIKRFPFPFHEDSYMYSVNMEQHRGGPEGSVYEKRFDVMNIIFQKWKTARWCWPMILCGVNRSRI